jgi:hypothetical protein
MTDREPPGPQQQDMPWNDSPADSEAPPGSEEPDPAEVVEDDDGDAVDTTDNPQLEADFYHRDSLDERLAEEEPERAPRGAQAPAAGELLASGNGDESAGGFSEDDDDAGDLGAEDAAIHVTDKP